MNFKRMLSLVLVLCMVLSFFPASAFADNDVVEEEVVEEVAEEPAAEEPAPEEGAPAPAEEEQPAPEEEQPAPAAAEEEEEIVEEEVLEEVVEEAQTVSEEAMAEYDPDDVAAIGGDTYDTLAEAVAAAGNGATINLINPLVETAAISINKDLTIIGTGTATVSCEIDIISGNVKLINVHTNANIFVDGGMLSIESGDYKTVRASSTVTSGNVTGGHFESLSTVLLADGYSLDPTDGKVKKAVATIGDVGYPSLASAVAAAKAGDTITMIADEALNTGVDVDKTVTIDLNGKTITNGRSFDTKSGIVDYLLAVKRGGKLTINDSVGTGAIITENSSVSVAVKMTIKGESETGSSAELTVNGGILQGYYYGISGNGTRHGTSIVINDGEIRGFYTNDSLGIYHPQEGSLTVNGGKISGYSSAIEMRAGFLEIKGGTFTSTAKTYSCESNGNGNTTVGAAIAVAQHNTKKAISVTISGGNFNGCYALSEANPEKNPKEDIDKVTLAVSGGVFTGTTEALKVEDCKKFVVDGTFSSEVPEALCKDGFIPVKNEDGTYGVKEGVYAVRLVDAGTSDGPGYTADDIQQAITDAAAGYAEENGKVLYVLPGKDAEHNNNINGTISKGTSIKVYVGENAAFKATKDAEASYYLDYPVTTGTVTDDTITYANGRTTVTLKSYAASITGADGKTKYYEDTPEKWSEAVSRAKKDSRLVLTPLVDGKGLTLANSESITIAKNEHKVAVTRRDSDPGWEILPQETDATIKYICAKPLTTVNYKVLNPDYEYEPAEPEYFMTFAEAAVFANEKNLADANAVATVTLNAAPDKTYSEDYTVGEEVDLLVKLGSQKWLHVFAPEGKALVTKANTPESGTTTYSVAASAAAVRTGSGSTATLEYYETFAQAVKVAGVVYDVGATATKTLVLYANVEGSLYSRSRKGNRR